MGLFNIDENISKIEFDKVLKVIRIIINYTGSYSDYGLFFESPINSNSYDDLTPANITKYLDFINHLKEQLDTLNNFLVDTSQNIPRQILEHFNKYPELKDSNVEDYFIRFDNDINPPLFFFPASHNFCIHFLIKEKGYKLTVLRFAVKSIMSL